MNETVTGGSREPINKIMAFKESDLFDKLRGIIAKQLGINEEKVVREAALFSDLKADPLDVFEFTCAIEEGFGMEIPVDVVSDNMTVGDIYDAVHDVLREAGRLI